MRTLLQGVAARLKGLVLHRPDIVERRETIGSDYGGHTVCFNKLPAKPIVYSFGVGEDASFDLELIARLGCEVFAYDPTPRSAAWVDQNIVESRFRFRALGLADHDGDADVVMPVDSEHVSLSTANGRIPNARIPVRRLETLLVEDGNERIDILKMDIEGFEYTVIDDLTRGSLRPGQIAVEFHHGMYGIPAERTHSAVTKLRGAGYRLFHVSRTGREYSFIRA